MNESQYSGLSITEAGEKLKELQGKISAYMHAAELILYDGMTAAPKGTAGNRAHSMGILSGEIYTLNTGKDTVELLEYLDEKIKEDTSGEADEKLKRMVYLMLKEIRNMQKIPKEEYIGYQELLVEADDVWHKAKEASDYAMFLPTLEKVFDTVRRFAGYCAPEKDPYDYWLNEYETGISKAVLDEFFAALRTRLVPLIKKITDAEQVDDSFLYGDFPAWKQEKLAYYLMDQIGLDRDHVGLSTTEHPFTISMGSHLDERITTNYKPENFSFSMYSVIHEGGHALYDTGSADDLAFTVLDGGVSMGIHESQSRFYENIIGRSRGFAYHILPKVKELFPETMKDVDEESFYKAVNNVEPSLIRTESDEVTYCLHIMIRYEIEKKIFAGELEVKDIPKEWNRLYKEYLGIDVPDDKHGALQDSHWSGGNIGYFPSYALGNAYGAQFLKKMKETVDVDACLKAGDLGPVNEWNREHIWQYGSLYEPSELLDRVLGEKFDPNVYLDYLEEKYKDIYGIG